MKTKHGYIDAISTEENIGFIVEEKYLTKFIFFLDEIPKSELKKFIPGTKVSFMHNREFETSMFVADNVTTSLNEMVARKAM